MDAFDGAKDCRPLSSLTVEELYERLKDITRDIPNERMEALHERIQMQDLEAVLRKAIVASGKTHYAIGKASGVAAGVIDRFAAGTRGITLATASKIAGVLGFGLVKIDPEPIPEAPAAKKATKKAPKRK